VGEVSQRLKYLQENWCSDFIVGNTPEQRMPADQPAFAYLHLSQQLVVGEVSTCRNQDSGRLSMQG